MKNANHIDALFVTGNDPWGEPKGGQTTFAKQLLKAFGSRLAVSSHSEEHLPVGKWIDRNFEGKRIKFLNRGPRHQKNSKKPIIPARITSYYYAKIFMPKIFSLGIRNVLVDCPELLFAISAYKWDSVCYLFAGVNNPVANSRYPCARVFGKVFERWMIRTLKKIDPDVMLAAADKQAIEEFFKRTGYMLDRSKLHQFPTRVDTELFYPMPRDNVRNELNLPLDATILVAIGRLNWIKGWDLLLDTLKLLNTNIPAIQLIFVGDGEDHYKLEDKARKLDIYENIKIIGFVPQSDIVKYINAADVCTVGSYQEGWSIAMCEIIACGKAIVSTDVSGARDMVKDGKNGYVVSNRDPKRYSDAVLNAMKLERVKEHSLLITEQYSLKNLAQDLGALWKPLE